VVLAVERRRSILEAGAASLVLRSHRYLIEISMELKQRGVCFDSRRKADRRMTSPASKNVRSGAEVDGRPETNL